MSNISPQDPTGNMVLSSGGDRLGAGSNVGSNHSNNGSNSQNGGNTTIGASEESGTKKNLGSSQNGGTMEDSVSKMGNIMDPLSNSTSALNPEQTVVYVQNLCNVFSPFIVLNLLFGNDLIWNSSEWQACVKRCILEYNCAKNINTGEPLFHPSDLSQAESRRCLGPQRWQDLKRKHREWTQMVRNEVEFGLDRFHIDPRYLDPEHKFYVADLLTGPWTVRKRHPGEGSTSDRMKDRLPDHVGGPARSGRDRGDNTGEPATLHSVMNSKDSRLQVDGLNDSKDQDGAPDRLVRPLMLPVGVLSRIVHPVVSEVLQFYTLPRSKSGSRSQGYCFVCFRTRELLDCWKAIIKNKCLSVGTRKLHVDFARIGTLDELKDHFNFELNRDTNVNVFWFDQTPKELGVFYAKCKSSWRSVQLQWGPNRTPPPDHPDHWEYWRRGQYYDRDDRGGQYDRFDDRGGSSRPYRKYSGCNSHEGSITNQNQYNNYGRYDDRYANLDRDGGKYINDNRGDDYRDGGNFNNRGDGENYRRDGDRELMGSRGNDGNNNDRGRNGYDFNRPGSNVSQGNYGPNQGTNYPSSSSYNGGNQNQGKNYETQGNCGGGNQNQGKNYGNMMNQGNFDGNQKNPNYGGNQGNYGGKPSPNFGNQGYPPSMSLPSPGNTYNNNNFVNNPARGYNSQGYGNSSFNSHNVQGYSSRYSDNPRNIQGQGSMQGPGNMVSIMHGNMMQGNQGTQGRFRDDTALMEELFQSLADKPHAEELLTLLAERLSKECTPQRGTYQEEKP